MPEPQPYRKSLRLPAYDYSEPGIYFVTVALKERVPLFGTVEEGGVHLNPAGQMVLEAWQKLPEKFPWADLDSVVVMPDHLHGLLVFGGNPDVNRPVALSQVIGWFKMMSTNWYGHGVKEQGWQPYNGSLWLRSFYERIVRNDRELEKFRAYIESNPARWMERREAPTLGGHTLRWAAPTGLK